MGLRRRRSFHCRGRRLLAIDDMVLDAAAGGDDASLVGEAALLASLEGPRHGRMTDVVATVQAEQDAVLRAPMAGLPIVPAAAGTGTPVVTLHRAAHLRHPVRTDLDPPGGLVPRPN